MLYDMKKVYQVRKAEQLRQDMEMSKDEFAFLTNIYNYEQFLHYQLFLTKDNVMLLSILSGFSENYFTDSAIKIKKKEKNEQRDNLIKKIAYRLNKSRKDNLYEANKS